MKKSKKLIIFGVQDFARFAFEYFTYDSDYEVVAFTVDAIYIKDTKKCGLPIVDFEELNNRFPAREYEVFAAISYSHLNKLRESICKRIKENGYKLASYISSKASIWRNVTIGEHCFILENNTIQPYAIIGNNVVMHSGNFIGHDSVINDHCYITAHVVIAGFVVIGSHCFIGVNCSIGDFTTVGNECWIGHGAVITGDIPAKSRAKSPISKITILNEKVINKHISKLSQNKPFK